jgi:hypothetical protein
MTTPTNAKDAWAVDFGVMGRAGDGDDSAATRAMLTYGFTEDVQLSVSAPFVFTSGPFAPARGTAMSKRLAPGDSLARGQPSAPVSKPPRMAD